MLWYFIGVYIINKTLFNLLEIQNLTSSVGKYFTNERNDVVKLFFNTLCSFPTETVQSVSYSVKSMINFNKFID